MFGFDLTRTHVRNTVSIMQNIRSESSTHLVSGALILQAPTTAVARLRVRPGRVALFLAIFGLVCSLSVPRLLAAVTTPEALRTHIVVQGETLWELARQYGSSEDPRPYVQTLRDANQLSSPQVFPGQELVLPAS